MRAQAFKATRLTAPGDSIAALLLILFFVSGASGLVYEIISVRLLRLVMGNTTFAISAVLAVFMGGLALGSYIGGRLADRRTDLLRIFGLLEAAVALYFLMAPALIDAIAPIFRFAYQTTHASFYAMSLFRLVLCGMVLLVPTTVMGATLPVLCRYVVRSRNTIGSGVGSLYSANTFGAVCGVAAAGFVMLPWMGVSRSLYVACAASFGVSAISLLLHYSTSLHQRDARQAREPAVAAPAAKPVCRDRTPVVVFLGAYGVAGFASLVYEVAWSRVLALLIGSSVYAFSLMLMAFIFGLAFGAALASPVADRLRDPMRALAGLQGAVGISALLVVPLFDRLPGWLTQLIHWTKDSFVTLILMEFGIALAIMLVPTTLMGAAFPIANRVYAQAAHGVGRTVGTVYSANTVGAILGSIAAGFVLIPALGIQHTIHFAVLANLVAGCALVALAESLSIRARLSAASAVTLAVVGGMSLVPPWDANRISYGPFMKATRGDQADLRSAGQGADDRSARKVVFHKEGVGSTITVKEHAGNLTLYVNGKPDASSHRDLPTQLMLAHVPLLMQADPKRVLVIGLASGITLGAAGQHGVKTLDCAEIAPEMIEAARLFDTFNHQILDDPRVTIHTADGRNHLQLTGQTYDVIISEPSNPWMAGVADLFTREFFQACRKRLTAGGMACVWLETYAVSQRAWQSILAAFQNVFPDVTVWSPQPGDYLLVGCKGGWDVPLERLASRLQRKKIRADLQRVPIRTSEEFLGHVVLDAQGVSAFVDDAREHTDDNALLEFSAPRTFFAGIQSALKTEVEVGRHRVRKLSFVSPGSHDGNAGERLLRRAVRRVEARFHLKRGQWLLAQEQTELAIAALQTAARLDRNDPWFREWFDGWIKLANRSARSGDAREATGLYEQLIRIDAEAHKAHYRLGRLLLRKGDVERGRSHLQRAVELAPGRWRYHLSAAAAAGRQRDVHAALRHYHQTVSIKPDEASALNNLALTMLRHTEVARRVLSLDDPLARAIDFAEEACHLTLRKNPQCLYTLANLYARTGRHAKAVATARQGLHVSDRQENPVLYDRLSDLVESDNKNSTTSADASRY